MPQELITFRAAQICDLAAIVSLLADDALGQSREDSSVPLATEYQQAFDAIHADANQLLAVAIDAAGVVVGTLQITLIPGISHRGAWRGQIEAVRVAKAHRGAGLGQQMFEWAISHCRASGCNLVQLTTDKTRSDAHRFYEKLGFVASHTGYKLKL